MRGSEAKFKTLGDYIPYEGLEELTVEMSFIYVRNRNKKQNKNLKLSSHVLRERRPEKYVCSIYIPI